MLNGVFINLSYKPRIFLSSLSVDLLSELKRRTDTAR
jgi:hypothetical protein